MQKPKNYDNIRAFGEFEPLELGGHVCKICKVEETKSRAGNDMIVIYLDIAEGSQKEFFANQFRTDPREEKRWPLGGVVYQTVEGKDGNTTKGFKTFMAAVKSSNPGFDENAVWGDNFASHFKDKMVGGVFGREQYRDNKSGVLKWSTKCVVFRPVDVIRKGVDVPDDKYLPEFRNNPEQEFSSSGSSGAELEDYPF